MLGLGFWGLGLARLNLLIDSTLQEYSYKNPMFLFFLFYLVSGQPIEASVIVV